MNFRYVLGIAWIDFDVQVSVGFLALGVLDDAFVVDVLFMQGPIWGFKVLCSDGDCALI